MAPAQHLIIKPLRMPWETLDPFLFCVHHDDKYPIGNDQMGPAALLTGRDLGQDFGGRDGWNMYHGTSIPGFPQHPHRGFETVTLVRKGLIDHSDSLGATARFGAVGIVFHTRIRLLRRSATNRRPPPIVTPTGLSCFVASGGRPGPPSFTSAVTPASEGMAL